MSIDLFRAGQGIELLSQDFTSNVNILTGTGAPGGDASFQDGAPIGSIYMRQDIESDNLQFYYKISLVNNSPVDWTQAADKNFVAAAVNGLSWREPARVMDETIFANPAALPTGGTIDGVILSDGDRVLFPNVASAGASNVYIWNATGNSWTEDTNAETDGDALLVQEGTHAEEQWAYDSTNWVQVGGAANTQELDFIRQFIGKTAAGAEMPSFSSTDIVTAGVNLETAIGELDAAIGTQLFVSNNFITDGEDTTSSLDALDAAMGSQVYASNNVITDGETFTSSLDALDAAVGNLQQQNTVINVLNVTTPVVVDSIPVGEADVMEWRIIVEDVSNSSRRISSTFVCMHDGAGAVDNTRYATVRRGGNIAGLTMDAAVNGGNIELTIASTGGVDIGIKRLVKLAAN
jgi:hypothetical protein